jgi:hypothetical protein
VRSPGIVQHAELAVLEAIIDQLGWQNWRKSD